MVQTLSRRFITTFRVEHPFECPTCGFPLDRGDRAVAFESRDMEGVGCTKRCAHEDARRSA